MRKTTALFSVAALLVGASSAAAHPHTVQANPNDPARQKLANGQNHGPYTPTAAGNRETCAGDPAAYGLETAHHGPDSGTAGKADGCYEIDGTVPAADDDNPAID